MKKSIWIKGLEMRKMTNQQIANYEFNARITNPDEPSDHELLKQLTINQASDHELLMDLAKSFKSDHELLKQLILNQASDHEILMDLAKSFKSDHELLKQVVEKVNKIEETLNNVIKLNNLRTK